MCVCVMLLLFVCSAFCFLRGNMCMYGRGVILGVTQPLVLILRGRLILKGSPFTDVHDAKNNVLISCLKGTFSCYTIQYEACCSLCLPLIFV